jgi:tripartite-type tricarboxylate transporter receptor subunit TctC
LKGAFVKLPRRKFLHLAAGAVAFPNVSRQASAQTYPTRPVHLIVGFPPGGVADLYARLIAQRLSDRLGQQVVVENRAGAGGSTAADAVARAASDGHTLLLTGSNHVWNMSLYDTLTFNFIRDIAPVASIARTPGVLVVLPSFPATTAPALIEYVKSNPGKITIASAGVGSTAHMFWELFRTMAAVDMQHVPYRGEAPALTDLLGGQVQVMMPTLPPAIEHIRAGKLRPLAVTAASRLEILPEIPVLGDFVPGYEASGWAGVGAPRNTSAEIIAKLNYEINAALADPKISAQFADQGATVFASSPAEFGKFIVEFNDKWAKVIRVANIKL